MSGHASSGPGFDENPQRVELFSVGQLEQHAQKVAAWHDVNPARRAATDWLLPRLDDDEAALREAHGTVSEALRRGRRITPAAEWLLDNYPLIEEQIRTARRHLPRGYDRELPRLASSSTGRPRVYDLVLELISHSDGRLDIEALRAFVTAYQSVRTLRLGELWAIPIMLRLALLENVRRVAACVTAGRRDREAAGSWVDRMVDVAGTAPARVVLVMAEMVEANPPLTHAFVAELASRLNGAGPALTFPMSWLEQRLGERGLTVEHVFQLVSQSQAADQVSIGNSIGGLRLLGATDWRNFVEAMSAVEHRLAEDPAGVYASMDFETRDRYRHVVEAIARRCGRTEVDVAAAAIALAKVGSERRAHVGHSLIGAGRTELERAVGVRTTPGRWIRSVVVRHRLAAYSGSIVGLTALLTYGLASLARAGGIVGFAWGALVVALAIATSQLASAVVQWIVTLVVRPSLLPRLDFSAGIPAAFRTAVAVPTMLTDEEEIDRLIEALEVRYLANRDAHLSFVLLSDFRDAPSEHVAGDDVLLLRAREGILALNARHVPVGSVPLFFLFHRDRQWNASEGVWMGWERKRGKIEQLNEALRGEDGNFVVTPAMPESLRAVKYVIALDSDTQLPRDAARKLVGTMAHPLNRPRFDERLGRVVEGYGILQPRVAITMASARRSRFSRLFSGEPGIDPYTRAVSDVYQDVFDEGSFVGKGIYDVDVFQEVLGGKLPENRILSHDLLEGAYARSGLVSDILLFEDCPSAYSVDVSRRERWMRGDWQLLGWIIGRVPGPASGRRVRNPLSLLARWKLVDNLRRSVVPVAMLAVLGLGWSAPGLAAAATLVVLAMLALPGSLAASSALSRRPGDFARRHHVRAVLDDLTVEFVRGLFALACLPYDALLGARAIVRTLGRVLLTGRRLLEWRTASDAQRSARIGLANAYSLMAFAPLVSVATAMGLAAWRTESLPAAVPILILWAVAPGFAHWLGLPGTDERRPLGADDAAFLRRIARRTWRFFESVVQPVDNDLPPDNLQIDPPQGIAHRTSPTNIGLSFTATLAAYDFGYVTVGELLERTSATLATMDRLSRHRGHFFNWYDTRTLEPLRPMYVSTVDSGNLAGHLCTFAAGLRELVDAPVFDPRVLGGLDDTAAVLEELAGDRVELRAALRRCRDALGAAPSTHRATLALLSQTEADARSWHAMVERGSLPDLSAWTHAFATQAARAKADLAWMAPWLELPEVDHDVATEASGADLDAAHALGAERASARRSRTLTIAARAEEFAEFDFDFLYDRERKLLAIGYDVGERRLDASFYDLLASEARLASFVGISRGKLPEEHWFSLGRSLTASGDSPALLSWSGSMFEYLMPLLIMPTYRATILDETYRGAVDRQIAYGRELELPWGVSESGYNKTDAQRNYQYRAFGVPGLGFKRGLGDDQVVAPYACALALMVAPAEACTNLRRLADDGQLGALGFYEAVDYTPSRLPPGKQSVTVASYMAHHQGMTLLSLAYALLGRPMQRRFDAQPGFRATELLLQERVPRVTAIYPHAAEVQGVGGAASAREPTLRIFTTPSTASPQVQLLSNGTYHVMVTNAGGGYSRYRDLAVTRWIEDSTRDDRGSFCYLRDVTTGTFWSAAHQPALVRATSYEAVFSQGRAEFRRRDGEIDTHVEISVSPEDDVELRRVSLTNRGRTPRTIELTSYAEVVLTTAAADVAHPAFSNLFVQTELVRARQAILASRRPRSSAESPPFMFHMMTVHGTLAGATSYETARVDFVGRGRSTVDPRAMHRASLGDSEGSVLDPIVAIRNTVVIGPDETVRVHLVTGIAETRELALDLVEKYGDRHSADRVLELSWTHSQVLLRQLDATEAETQLYERIASHILYSNPEMRAQSSILARNRRGQSSLWAYAISGDLPIALVRVTDRQNIGLVRQMIKAHAYLRLKGLAIDLVIWNEDPSGYRQTLHDEILVVVASFSETERLDWPGGIFVRRSDQIAEEDKVLFQTVARLIVVDGEGSLAEQLDRKRPVEIAPARFVGKNRRAGPLLLAPSPARVERTDLAAWNGFGGFTPDGREYVITSTRDERTPAPWVNVIANPYFGTVVSESGGAYTWCENARHHRLTPWNDDPVSDPSGEAFYLRDERDGRFWSPTVSPAPGGSTYTTRHGFGYSVFEYTEDGIASELRTFVATDAPLKFVLFKLTNHSGRMRRISLTGVFDLVLGQNRASNVPYVVTEVDAGSGALLARNAYASEFTRRVAFLDCSEETRWYSGDRQEIVGRNGTPTRPAFVRTERLSGRVGAALDPCLAMQVVVDLADGQEREIAFTFGSGLDLGDARTLIHRFRGVAAARSALDAVWSYWNRTLGTVHVKTPDPTFDFLANGWLLYQVLAARMWGRSGFYQSGGAFGFRDQLQDAMSLVHAEPTLLREQIVRSSSRQFREGDVQHWWHPPLGWGVRTRISDDYLWLPYAVCRYVGALGDTGVLDERTPYLEGRAVKPDEDSYYDLPLRSDESGSVYEHCVRAIERGLRFGVHGLPLMGSGDWNDGMNLVGDDGRGESVWLAFFLHDVLVRFAGIARLRADAVFADRCTAAAATLSEAIETHGWDGEWYRRAYFDDGSPLGSASNDDCQIDSLPQSWSVLSHAGDPARASRALDALDRRLMRRDLQLIQLFDPPFDHSSANPGYVKGYVPGVRENGGQYTHAAVWAAMAFAESGDGARAWESFRMLNPIRHGDGPSSIERYVVEPYVVAADVYTNPQHAGRGGWTWYTGAAGWMYRLAIESLLGVHLEVDHLRIDPLLPPDWGGFELHYRYRSTVYHLHVCGPRTGGRGVRRTCLDGCDLGGSTIPLVDDGREHFVEVWVGDVDA